MPVFYLFYEFSWHTEEPREGGTLWNTGLWNALLGKFTPPNFKCLLWACSLAKPRYQRRLSPCHRIPEDEGVNPSAAHGSIGTALALLPDHSANPVFFRQLKVASTKKEEYLIYIQVGFKVQ